MKIKLDKLDVLFSKIVRLRAGGYCEHCGQYKGFKGLQCSHFFGRRRKSVRYDIENAAGLCFSCHSYLGENPYVHTEWFKKRLGSERFERLSIRAEMIVKPDRHAIEAELRNILKTMEGEYEHKSTNQADN